MGNEEMKTGSEMWKWPEGDVFMKQRRDEEKRGSKGRRKRTSKGWIVLGEIPF